MNLKESIKYLGNVDEDCYQYPELIGCCSRKQKKFYTIGVDWEDHVTLCGFCLVKHANGWKEHTEKGGV